MFGSLRRRAKRRVLDLLVRAGYDVEKRPGHLPPYRLLKRIRLGRDALSDARTILGDTVRCVFDVGAHVGQTAERLARAFPDAEIYSFEPDPDSFKALHEVAGARRRIHPVNAAVGDQDGDSAFFVNTFGMTSSLLEPAPDARQFLVDTSGLTLKSRIRVPVVTLDRFCADRRIDRIDVLKLDAQGYELRILDGARALLDRRALPLIYLEVSFVQIYDGQPLFPEVYQYLFDRGYRLVWLYETSFHTHLYAVGADALFIHHSIGERLRPGEGR